MAKLVISRKSQFINRANEFKIYLNGQELGVISSGETIELDIPEGKSIIKAKINWMGSQDLPISVKNDESKFISISGTNQPNIFMGLMSLMTLLILTIGRQMKADFPFLKVPVLIITSFFLIASCYYLTFGRNKYIKIKENP